MGKYYIIMIFFGLLYSQGAGDALDFDGTNDFVQINDANTLEGMSNLTIQFWVKFTS